MAIVSNDIAGFDTKITNKKFTLSMVIEPVGLDVTELYAIEPKRKGSKLLRFTKSSLNLPIRRYLSPVIDLTNNIKINQKKF